MLSKLFSIEKDFCHYKITILGLKMNIRSLKLTTEYLKKNNSTKNYIPATRGFIYTNNDSLTAEQKNWYLSRRFYEALNYYPNLKKPKSFNEKINWMKINYYNPNEKYAIDKYEFKNYVKNVLGDGYTIPLIGVYNDVNDIDFSSLPNQFVIKTTANGSMKGVKVVKDLKNLNIDELKYDFANTMQEWNSVYYSCLSRGYKDIKPRIIIEEYMSDIDDQLYDYKFFCFHGEVKFIYVAIDHFEGVKSKISLFDTSWNKLPVKYDGHPNINKKIEKPAKLKETIEIAEKFAKDFPFVRVDFYLVKDKIYVGELTFTPGGGFGKYDPIDFDCKMGEWLDLNKLNPKYLNN